MTRSWRYLGLGLAVVACSASAQEVKEVTLLYTNDFHSAIDPIPAYWLEASPRLGGAAHLSTLVNQIRNQDSAVFLFDAGDMFTGAFSFLTKGEVIMEMMAAMRYDAMGIGNHEFDYGAENFTRQMHRVPFPVLGANIFYKESDHRYARPHAIVERDGVRIGVIGVIGEDAWSVSAASGITEIEFRDPVSAIKKSVSEIGDSVDLIVVVAHQGKTGPMQTDAENRPEVQRDFDADIALIEAVPEIDVLLGGHPHRGIEPVYESPKTGALIGQTYGYGTRLGYLRLWVSDGKILEHEDRLIKVWSDRLEADARVVAALAPYRAQAKRTIGEVVGRSEARLVREYNRESVLGNAVADAMAAASGAQVALTNAGGLRADIPEGAVTRGHVLDALPFESTLFEMELTGAQLVEIVEQGLTLERGMIQMAGVRVTYDLSRSEQDRIVSFQIAGRDVERGERYRVVTNSFLADGGDLYLTLQDGTSRKDTNKLLSQVFIDYLGDRPSLAEPRAGRLVPVRAE